MSNNIKRSWHNQIFGLVISLFMMGFVWGGCYETMPSVPLTGAEETATENVRLTEKGGDEKGASVQSGREVDQSYQFFDMVVHAVVNFTIYDDGTYKIEVIYLGHNGPYSDGTIVMNEYFYCAGCDPDDPSSYDIISHLDHDGDGVWNWLEGGPYIENVD